jgi:uncharacterized protein DUF1579
MKSRNLVHAGRILAIFSAALLLLSTASPAAEKPGDKTAPAKPAANAQGAEQDMMAAYMKYATPGPEHELLKSLAGNWKAVTKSWMGPGDPQVSEGRAVRTVILGGRYLKDEYTTTFMNQPFEGFGITGYDLLKKEYVSTWSDTMGTAILISRGKADASGKVLTLVASYDDPVTGQKKTMKEVTKILDPNKNVFEIWEDNGGKEVKSMEVTYTRE